MANFRIGIDIGGTFTDTCGWKEETRTLRRAKALTNYKDLGAGCIDATSALAREFNLSTEELLKQTKVIVNGTTLVSNAMISMAGVRVGLITTKGFEATLRIGRMIRWAGCFDNQLLDILPEMARYEDVKGVTERIDYKGSVVCRLNEDEARQAIRELVEEHKVEALAISLLWSFRNPTHELRIEQIAHDMYPQLQVSVSHKLIPVIREYERTTTTVMDAFIKRMAIDYVDGLERKFRQRGFEGSLLLVNCLGGFFTPADAKANPVKLILSGPVAGAYASTIVGRAYNVDNVIAADVGGTTFDISVIPHLELGRKHRVYLKIGDHASPGILTGLTVLDVTSIGAGGGTIGWIDARGMLRMGPTSAGSVPGPACFDRGGKEPTLTDAFVVLNVLDPDRFAGVTIKPKLAVSAVRKKISEPQGISTEEAALGMYRVVLAAQTASLTRAVAEKNMDPRGLSLVLYGGAGGLVASGLCESLYLKEVIIPPNGAVFSAWGLLNLEYRQEFVRSVHWRQGMDLKLFNETLLLLRETATKTLANAGYSGSQAILESEVDIRFIGQHFEILMPLLHGPEEVTEADMDALLQKFPGFYETMYGEGTAWTGFPAEIVNVRVKATGVGKHFRLKKMSFGPKDPSSARTTEREVTLPPVGEHMKIPIYDWNLLRPGMIIQAPSIVQGNDSTVWLTKGFVARVDEFENIRLVRQQMKEE